MNNFPGTIISQYSDSPTLCQMIANFNACVDPWYNLENFYTQVWDIQSASGYGLDRIGRVIGVGRVLQVALPNPFLGFTGVVASVQQASGDSFNTGIYYSGQKLTGNFSMTDEAYRKTILAKAAANITNGSTQSINYILMNILFPNRGTCYVKDNTDMTMVYTFDFPLYSYEVSIIANSGVMPTPCGVFATISYPGLI